MTLLRCMRLKAVTLIGPQVGEGRRPHTRQQTRRMGPPKLSRPQYQWRLLESSRRLYTGSLPQLLPAPGEAATSEDTQPSSAQTVQRQQLDQLRQMAVEREAGERHRVETLALTSKLKHARELRKQLASVMSSIETHGQEVESLADPILEAWERAGPKPQYPKRVITMPNPTLLLQQHTEQRRQVLANLGAIAPGTVTPQQFAMLYKQIHDHVQLLLQVQASISPKNFHFNTISSTRCNALQHTIMHSAHKDRIAQYPLIDIFLFVVSGTYCHSRQGSDAATVPCVLM